MKVRKRALSQLGAALALCLVAGACTPPGPQDPTPAPAPPSTSPTETQLERQSRLDFEAAEKAYRLNMAEQNRVFGPGVAKKVTQRLLETSAGKYLDLLRRGLNAAREEGWHTDNPTIIVSVSEGAYKQSELTLTACEDYRKVKLRYGDGKSIRPKGSRLYVQTLTIRSTDGRWKVTDLNSKEVATLAGDPRCSP